MREKGYLSTRLLGGRGSGGEYLPGQEEKEIRTHPRAVAGWVDCTQ